MAEQQEMDLRDIEKTVQSSNTKLPELKNIAKQLKIKITRLKKDEIVKILIDTLYDPKRYFNELYDDKETKLNDKKTKDTSGKDHWLHKFTKYKVNENYSLVIIKRHPHEISLETNSQFKIGMIMNDDISKLTPKYAGFHLSTIKCIKTAEDVKLIKTLCDEKELQYKEVNREHLTDFERICRPDLIKDIVGHGTLCMQSYPCVHSLKYIGTDDKTYMVKYAGYRFIRELYINLYGEDDLPDHFEKKI